MYAMAGEWNPGDDHMKALLYKNAETRLHDVQARSASWVQLVPAATAILCGAFAIIGPETAKNATTGYKVGLVLLMIAAYVTMAWATYQFYIAAYGHPSQILEIDVHNSLGLATRVRDAQRKLSEESMWSLRRGLCYTFWGIALMVIALAVAMFAEQKGESIPRGVALASMNDELEQYLVARRKV
eukprot:scaffold274381_cov52-Attheya_sp.AAC.2